MGAEMRAPESEVTGFATDSGGVRPGDLFLAIQGARVDGHDYARAAMEAGAVAVVASRSIPEPHLLVDDLPTALARMASWFRNEFDGPVVGITGSAGKTTTKEFIAAALGTMGPVLKTVGNRNTEYTAPLLWAELTPEHRSVVVEMGMRGFGQIAHLATFSRPNIGVITNIGHSHMELVGDRAGIARAKGELLQSLPIDGVAVLPSGDDFLEYLQAQSPRSRTFGFIPDSADNLIFGYSQIGWTGSELVGILQQPSGERVWTTQLPAAGMHFARNAAAAVLTASEAGVDPDVAADALALASLPPMRMEVRSRNGVIILLDTYNAAPGSMQAALEVLTAGPARGTRRAVIGEMRELGGFSEQAHRELAQWLVDAGVQEAIFVGAATQATIEAARRPGYRLANGIDEVKEFVSASQPGDVVLIKGSRAFELERALD